MGACSSFGERRSTMPARPSLASGVSGRDLASPVHRQAFAELLDEVSTPRTADPGRRLQWRLRVRYPSAVVRGATRWPIPAGRGSSGTSTASAACARVVAGGRSPAMPGRSSTPTAASWRCRPPWRRSSRCHGPRSSGSAWRRSQYLRFAPTAPLGYIRLSPICISRCRGRTRRSTSRAPTGRPGDRVPRDTRRGRARAAPGGGAEIDPRRSSRGATSRPQRGGSPSNAPAWRHPPRRRRRPSPRIDITASWTHPNGPTGAIGAPRPGAPRCRCRAGRT